MHIFNNQITKKLFLCIALLFKFAYNSLKINLTLSLNIYRIVNNKFIGLALFFLCLTNSYGQDQNSILTQIKQTFQKINNNKNYEIIIIDNSDDFLGHSPITEVV